jgi:hypothetical protein
MPRDLGELGRCLVGRWTTEATHPAFPGTSVHGSAEVTWLEGEKFLIFRAWTDHPKFPDAISILGDTQGLKMHYFDDRGVHRVYELGLTDDGWAATLDAPGWWQQMRYAFTDDDTIEGTSRLAQDEAPADDLAITYRRT